MDSPRTAESREPRHMPTICCRAHLLDESAPETRERETLRPSSEVPPLPWTSPALLQPWPDAASDYQEVRDAHGKPVFIRNWREVASAIRYVVQLVNREHFAALAPPPPDDERLRAAAKQALDWFVDSAGEYFAKYGDNDDPTPVLRAALAALPDDGREGLRADPETVQADLDELARRISTTWTGMDEARLRTAVETAWEEGWYRGHVVKRTDVVTDEAVAEQAVEYARAALTDKP